MIVCLVLLALLIFGLFCLKTGVFSLGEFTKRKSEPWQPGERAPVKKPQDNLHPEGMIIAYVILRCKHSYLTETGRR